MARTVTIGKTYFEALLRRAEHRNSYNEEGEAIFDPTAVTIPKAEHDHLLRASQEYNRLKRALYRGGIAPETLEVLISSDGRTDAEGDNVAGDASSSVGQHEVPLYCSGHNPGSPRAETPDSEAHQESLFSRVHLDSLIGKSVDMANTSVRVRTAGNGHRSPEVQDYNTRPETMPRNEKRTLLFTNLSQQTTHKDLASIIRGGQLLEIHLRNDRSALVSFVNGAQEFLDHVKRHDYYLHAKRVDIRWSERQFHMSSYVASKVAEGATRNLLVRGGAHRLTEEEIRDDLEHIHNLVVINVSFKDGDVYISTNSVHNALFARTCMISRSKYKGLRIGWFDDECASPLPEARAHARPPSPREHCATPRPWVNRYTALNGDTSEQESENDRDSTDNPKPCSPKFDRWSTYTGIAV